MPLLGRFQEVFLEDIRALITQHFQDLQQQVLQEAQADSFEEQEVTLPVPLFPTADPRQAAGTPPLHGPGGGARGHIAELRPTCSERWRWGWDVSAQAFWRSNRSVLFYLKVWSFFFVILN